MNFINEGSSLSCQHDKTRSHFQRERDFLGSGSDRANPGFSKRLFGIERRGGQRQLQPLEELPRIWEEPPFPPLENIWDKGLGTREKIPAKWGKTLQSGIPGWGKTGKGAQEWPRGGRGGESWEGAAGISLSRRIPSGTGGG